MNYYTARVSGMQDPDQPRRQQIYFNALQTLPNLQIHYGSFLSKKIIRPLANPIAGLPKYVEVCSQEEKGSDVNLATHLVYDGCMNKYDVAIVITKDTDLVEPIRIITQELGKKVGIICPDSALPPQLKKVSTFIKHIRIVHLAKSQFPDQIRVQNNTISKPSGW
ncbi:MAG: NYN domain-containing protein [Desulfomicrobium sp.]|nr:NYN domain-containing protein [Desulfomicrobium sp.]